jgi:hypothetical protein
MSVIAPLGRIRNEILGAIAARGIPVPTYDRSLLLPRILHLGVGGFHRALKGVKTRISTGTEF